MAVTPSTQKIRQEDLEFEARFCKKEKEKQE
jgi:hypothetical protein